MFGTLDGVAVAHARIAMGFIENLRDGEILLRIHPRGRVHGDIIATASPGVPPLSAEFSAIFFAETLPGQRRPAHACIGVKPRARAGISFRSLPCLRVGGAHPSRIPVLAQVIVQIVRPRSLRRPSLLLSVRLLFERIRCALTEISSFRLVVHRPLQFSLPKVAIACRPVSVHDRMPVD